MRPSAHRLRIDATTAPTQRPIHAETPVEIRRRTETEPDREPPGHSRNRRIRRVAADLLVLGVIAVLAYALWPVRLGGATSFVIVKGTSMEPRFHTGDLAIVRTEPGYQVGDIIAYRIPAGHTISGENVIHRIVAVRPDGTFVTRGENRTSDDPWHPTAHDVVGRYRLLVGLPGIRFWALIPWLCCALIGAAVIWLLWPRHTTGDLRDAEAPSDHDRADHDHDHDRDDHDDAAPLPVRARERLAVGARLSGVFLIVLGLMIGG